ncbi:hypothetical protein TNCV_5119791 [Trichonephila clavipes]|nr:hypothetical protein TNCV_5119791 [Trichonephila clavipes]
MNSSNTFPVFIEVSHTSIQGGISSSLPRAIYRHKTLRKFIIMFVIPLISNAAYYIALHATSLAVNSSFFGGKTNAFLDGTSALIAEQRFLAAENVLYK